MTNSDKDRLTDWEEVDRDSNIIGWQFGKPVFPTAKSITVFTKGYDELCKYDYSAEYRLSLEQERSLSVYCENIKSRNLRGDFKRLNADEKKIVSELLEDGKTVEVLPESDVHTPDLIVDGLKTEIKALNSHNLNTPLSKIDKAFMQQEADVVIYDVRKVGLTKSEIEVIYSRVCGKYKDGLPGILEFWYNEGKKIYYP